MFGIANNKGEKFSRLFQQDTEILCQVASKLESIIRQSSVSIEDNEEMNHLEHQADDITIQITKRLNSTFITPFDREDIYAMSQVLDDIVDFAQGTVERMMLYRTGKPSEGAQELVRLITLAAEQIRTAFSGLSNIHQKKEAMLEATEEIYRLEVIGDKVYRKEVARLFECEKDPIEIIKWKEILEHLETVLDHCEKVADLLKGVVYKYD
jgi:predicted phosphate transport protein (TIGR00153 family)